MTLIKKYSIGMDFGTLSARAILVEVDTGAEVAVSVVGYQDAVIDDMLPGTKIKLPVGYALQNPKDYIEALESLLRDILLKSGVHPEQIIGIGVDSTASTIIPVDKNYRPLCIYDEFKNNPHSWPKLWKHHGAQKQADTFNRIADEMGQEFLNHCGGKVSAEWLYPKVMEILEEAPEIYDATYRFMELSDWLVYLLTGKEKRNSTVACLHAQWDVTKGFPSKAFFKAIDTRLENIIEDKLGTQVYSSFEKAGGLTEEMAEKTKLCAGTAVCMGNSDSPVAIPGLGVVQEGIALLVIGTSSMFMLLSKEDKMVQGAIGMAKDVLLPGYYGHLFGQSAVGDIFDWFMNNMVPYKYYLEAEEKDLSIFDVMNQKVEKILPGRTGLLGLDWFNGNRSVLQNADLSGLIVGITLLTTTEHIYRALIESTAFGLKMIIKSIMGAGIAISEIYACGGLARKSPTILQIFTDILGIRIRIAASSQTIALGSAIMGALAAGSENGGFDNLEEAVSHMSKLSNEYYEPDLENHDIYDRCFAEYEKLHDYFGKGRNNVMHTLRKMNKELI